jgi:c-di-GMP-binding flagellar brake protein YcgR
LEIIMFKRTMTFWRRLLGRPGRTATATLESGSDERRVWIRYPADLEAAFKPSGLFDSARLSARVRNISLGGINLAGDRPFQPGELLTIELPGANEESPCNVLACVVHCAEEQAGEWSLGCTFSRELTDEDLAHFGARRERPDPSDQRQWKRFPASVTACYQRVASDDERHYAAKVLDISATGVGLLVDRDIENGTLLSVELHNAAGTAERTMLACIVHVTRQASSEWALGCNFIRSLSEQDLKALV